MTLPDVAPWMSPGGGMMTSLPSLSSYLTSPDGSVRGSAARSATVKRREVGVIVGGEGGNAVAADMVVLQGQGGLAIVPAAGSVGHPDAFEAELTAARESV